jgi:hypothetical protein
MTSTRTRKPAAHERPQRRAVARTPLARVDMPNARVVDLTRVAKARRRIASGWYDRSDVRDSLVEAVLEEMRGR